ncbi:hypothetical protein R1flu_027867 [Riccia fluitans]|uniref:Uncharacterized protein n=1 Tax=Riccia fluitans TaxID=41844 RepID=A0ABD1XK19_9MARC
MRAEAICISKQQWQTAFLLASFKGFVLTEADKLAERQTTTYGNGGRIRTILAKENLWIIADPDGEDTPPAIPQTADQVDGVAVIPAVIVDADVEAEIQHDKATFILNMSVTNKIAPFVMKLTTPRQLSSKQLRSYAEREIFQHDAST